MLRDDRIWMACTEDDRPLSMIPRMANRHGLIAGATGTGKTVTLKVLAETFSDMGVPVFLADVKGDLASVMASGTDTDSILERRQRFQLTEEQYPYQGYPTVLWDLYGEKGIPLRTTVSEMGPLLLARILQLNELQSGVLSIAFKIADDHGWLLYDTKDLKALLNEIQQNGKEYEADYGRISTATIGAITRSVVALEIAGGDRFFGEPGLNILDWLSIGEGGRGVIQILDSSSLVNSGVLYSTFLLWFLAELFETLPEIGDQAKPRMVFFFDEAHLLFKDTSKALLDKIEQVVKLIRSKGVGIYFCTQNPRDIPDGVLSQLGNKIQHGLHAYTPSDQRAVKAAAESFRANPNFNTYETILSLGTGEAVISFLDDDGIPMVCEKGIVLPPRSRMGAISEEERQNAVLGSLFYSKYANAVDSDSAYEMPDRLNAQKAESEAAEAAEAERKKAEEKERIAQEKAAEKAKIAEEKAAAKKKEQEEKAKKRIVKSVASTMVGSVGREAGKAVGKSFGSTGKTIGGNVGASLGRGLLNTLFKI